MPCWVWRALRFFLSIWLRWAKATPLTTLLLNRSEGWGRASALDHEMQSNCGKRTHHCSTKSQTAVDNWVICQISFKIHLWAQLTAGVTDVPLIPYREGSAKQEKVLWPDLEYFQSMFPILKAKGIYPLPHTPAKNNNKNPTKQQTITHRTREWYRLKGNFEIIPANGLFLQVKHPRPTDVKAHKYLRGWHRPSTEFF